MCRSTRWKLAQCRGDNGIAEKRAFSRAPSRKTCAGETLARPTNRLKRLAVRHRRMIFVCFFPMGTTRIWDGAASALSGGQKQRLCIARALLKKPKIIILDDSTSAVDTATDSKIRQALREKLAGTTTFIIAQRVTSVQDADRIIVLNDGRIDAVGTHEECWPPMKFIGKYTNPSRRGWLNMAKKLVLSIWAAARAEPGVGKTQKSERDDWAAGKISDGLQRPDVDGSRWNNRELRRQCSQYIFFETDYQRLYCPVYRPGKSESFCVCFHALPDGGGIFDRRGMRLPV